MQDKEQYCEGAPQSHDITWYLGVLLVFWILVKIALSLWRGIYSCFLGHLLGFGVNWKKLGSWAAITGATDGIGKEYAKQLAAKGFNIALISRTEEKLRNVAKEIEEKYKVQTRVVKLDVTDDVSAYDVVRKSLDDIDVGVLVNNVGMSYKHAEYLTKIDGSGKFAEDCIKANIVSTVKMTQIVLPQMESRKKGVIINISSLSALSPVPLLSLYSASKAYVNFFTQAVQEEYRSRGITVQSVLPGFVSTTMSKMRPSFTVCTADKFVSWALRTVGIEDVTYGYPVHKLQGYVQEILALYFPTRLNLVFAYRMMSDLRRRYYKKYKLTESKSLSKSE